MKLLKASIPTARNETTYRYVHEEYQNIQYTISSCVGDVRNYTAKHV